MNIAMFENKRCVWEHNQGYMNKIEYFFDWSNSIGKDEQQYKPEKNI